MGVIGLLDKKLLHNTQDNENKIFYLKMKADYYRYLAEFIIEENLEEIIDKADKTYEEASTLAEDHLPVNHPLRLGTMLNQTVFIYEIKQNATEAYKLAEVTFNRAISKIDVINEEDYKDSVLMTA